MSKATKAVIKINLDVRKKYREKLTQHKEAIQKTDLRKMFAEDSNRFETFTRTLDGLLVDFSKNLITQETVKLLSERKKGSLEKFSPMWSILESVAPIWAR